MARPDGAIALSHVSVRAYINYLEAQLKEARHEMSETTSRLGWEASARHAERTGGTM